MHRRNFDAEIASKARLEAQPSGPAPIAVPPRPSSDRIFVIHRDNGLLVELLSFRVNIKPVGSDWHITARTPEERARLLALFARRGVHGIMKRRHADSDTIRPTQPPVGVDTATAPAK